MTKRDCQSGDGAAFQAAKGGFDSRVPLHSMQKVANKLYFIHTDGILEWRRGKWRKAK